MGSLYPHTKLQEKMTIAKRYKDELLKLQRVVGEQMQTDLIRSGWVIHIHIPSMRRNGNRILTKSNTLHVLASIQTVGAPQVNTIPLRLLTMSDKRAKIRRAGVSIHTLKWYPRLRSETSYLLDRESVESIQTVGASQVNTKPLRSCARPRRAGVSIDEAEGQIYRKETSGWKFINIIHTPYPLRRTDTWYSLDRTDWVEGREASYKSSRSHSQVQGAQVHEVRAQNPKVAQVEPPAQQPAPLEPAEMLSGAGGSTH